MRRFFPRPAIAGTRIFTAACQSDLGGYTGLLACLDAQTGKSLWQTNSLNDDVLKPFFSSPALTQDGKYLVIGQGLHEDRDCLLMCFDAANGKLRWSVKSSLHIESSPAIFGDIAVVGAGAIEGPDGRATGDTGHVIAVRISDGKELWRQPVIDPESSPVIDEEGIAYIGSGFNGSAVVALRTQSDDQLKAKNLSRIVWQTAVAQPATAAISLIGDVVIAGGGNSDVVHSSSNPQGFVAAIERKTGQVRLADAAGGCGIERGGGAGRPADLPDSHRRSSGVSARYRPCRSGGTHIGGNSPVIAGCGFTGERIYAVSSDGYLAILDPKTGSMLEKFYLNDQGSRGRAYRCRRRRSRAGASSWAARPAGCLSCGLRGKQRGRRPVMPLFTPGLFDCRDAALVGGKAVNLGRLIRAGFPVPGGFVVNGAGLWPRKGALRKTFPPNCRPKWPMKFVPRIARWGGIGGGALVRGGRGSGQRLDGGPI